MLLVAAPVVEVLGDLKLHGLVVHAARLAAIQGDHRHPPGGAAELERLGDVAHFVQVCQVTAEVLVGDRWRREIIALDLEGLPHSAARHAHGGGDVEERFARRQPVPDVLDGGRLLLGAQLDAAEGDLARGVERGPLPVVLALNVAPRDNDPGLDAAPEGAS